VLTAGEQLLTLVQLVDTARVDDCIQRFNRAIWNLCSCSLLIALEWTVLLGDLPPYPKNAILAGATGVQMIATIVVMCALASIERRPDIYRPDGTVVERQFKASLWARYSYSWSDDIIDLAALKPIDIADMPAPDSRLRSKETKEKFRDTSLKPTVKLWILIFWNMQAHFYWQWFLITISCLFDVAPQFTLMKLLQFLENRQEFNRMDPQGWFWVGAMSLVTLGSTMIDCRIMWMMMADIALPLRSILTTLIFEKMMRIKDTKEPSSEKEDEDDATKDQDATSAKPETESKSKKPQSQQDVVNMFAVDTNLISLFAGNQQFYLNFVVRVILAIVFLWLLVGWVSMLTGMSVMVLMYPANHFLGKKYAVLQKQLMEARDTKTKVITEALNGIRQIKFSSIESQWADKIEKDRAKELDLVWKSKLNNVYMGFISDLSPVLFAAFALATYSYLNGNLMPSVAFTALSLFMQLEGLMHMIPMLLTMGVNAKVSLDRIDDFLQAPEKEENTHPGDNISFSNVALTFPSDSRKAHGDDRFVLRDITLDFPNGALSVISGPTGSGKSLLLTAILGEADVLSGDIRVPRPPPVAERFDNKATAANWILPTAKAYVGQTPWIENATIRNNILFGLPYDPIRYEKVIKACALTKDLAMFEDGDSTEVGAQGISLSGGQRWRLTLARAFYSRAGILILDDVFSALDAHVGKEIYENALMGELSKGRTRILVTHHVSLCLPRAKYAVRLGARGTLEHAGLTELLRETGSLADILNAEDGDESSVNTLTISEEPLDQAASGSAAPVTKAPPKKLVEEEARETGRVKTSVYTHYLKSSGGFPFWTLIVVVYIISQVLTLTRSWWIKIWTSSSEHAKDRMMHIMLSYSTQTQFFTAEPSASTLAIDNELGNLGFYLGVYIAISLVSITVGAARVYFVYRGSLGASRRVFTEMTYSVLRAPLRWLDTVPTGRILNRFTADFQNFDSQLSLNFAYLAAIFLEVIGILAVA
jgi:ABC-type multidrug transport system fused ATPase/permease subunit